MGMRGRDPGARMRAGWSGRRWGPAVIRVAGSGGPFLAVLGGAVVGAGVVGGALVAAGAALGVDAAGAAVVGADDGVGSVSAAVEGGAPAATASSGVSSFGPVNATVAVTTAMPVPTRTNGAHRRRGQRPRRTGCSTRMAQRTARPRVRARRATFVAAVDQPVRSGVSQRNTGQWMR